MINDEREAALYVTLTFGCLTGLVLNGALFYKVTRQRRCVAKIFEEDRVWSVTSFAPISRVRCSSGWICRNLRRFGDRLFADRFDICELGFLHKCISVFYIRSCLPVRRE